jgi:predicted TIM-barrel fold metal-dependent hydrolase
LNGPSPNAVLSDIHQIASGVEATVAVLSALSNRKSRVYTRQPPPSAVDCPTALNDSALPASVCADAWPPSGLRDHAQRRDSKLLYASNAVSDLIMTGVLERYPRLKFVLLENEVSWIPFYLTQYDKYWGRGNLDSPLTMLPSEYFNRQFYAKFFNDPPARWIFDTWGSNNLMWSNDYPHPNST